MALFVELSNAREWADETLAPLFAEGFPAFITADHEAKKYIGRVREWFTDFDIILVDDHDQPRAAGWGVPLEWNGLVGGLPAGYTDAIGRAVNDRESGITPNTFVICGGIVHPEDKGGTVAQELIAALCSVAKQHDLAQVIAPVRPLDSLALPIGGESSLHGARFPNDDWLSVGVGSVDEHEISAIRKLRNPQWAFSVSHRPRNGPRHLHRAKRMGST
jgi:hypothetical protein